MIDVAGCQKALIPTAQVLELELVRIERGVLGILEVDPPHPVATPLEVGDEVVTDEPSRARHKHTDADVITHGAPPR
jgi:hypothetical protein